MKIRLSVVGKNSGTAITWPEGWPVPRVDEEIDLGENSIMFVRHVSWYPNGMPSDGESEPFVYIVVGDRLLKY